MVGRGSFVGLAVPQDCCGMNSGVTTGMMRLTNIMQRLHMMILYLNLLRKMV
jgi:hypothetical protein